VTFADLEIAMRGIEQMLFQRDLAGQLRVFLELGAHAVGLLHFRGFD
jgi:hypothetical protein